MKQSDELSKIALQGLRYLQTYAWLSLRTLVTAGYLGWIAFAFTTAVDVYMLDGKTDVQRSPGLIITFVSILIGLYSLLFFRRHQSHTTHTPYFQSCFGKRSLHGQWH